MVRFLCPNHRQIDALTLNDVKTAIRAQLQPQNIEISISGDVPISTLESLVLQYMGTVPTPKGAQAAAATATAVTPLPESGAERIDDRLWSKQD